MTWGPSAPVRGNKGERVKRVKVVTSTVSLVLRDKIDKDTAAAIAAVRQNPRGTLSIKIHNKLPALVALGKHLGMFDQRTQKTNVVYAISDKPMTKGEWVKRYVTPHDQKGSREEGKSRGDVSPRPIRM